MPAEAAGEQVLTVEELAKRFNVSTKTISRWRRQGLVSRRFVMDGRKRVGFLQSSVDRFVERNQERVRRGSQFSQLTDEERATIIERARRLARAGGCPADVTKRLARKTGRSAETIRYTLKQFDHDHPEAAVFPDSHGPLQQDAKRKIYQQYQRGESVEALAKRFCRTRTSIYRIIAEMRAQRIMELPLDFIPNDVFARVRSQKARGPGARAGARVGGAGEEVAAAQRLAAVPGQPVRGAAADAEAGGPSVPQDELPEVQGRPAPRQARSGPAASAA